MNERKRNMKLAGIKESAERNLSIHFPTDYAKKLAQLLNDKQRLKGKNLGEFDEELFFSAGELEGRDGVSVIEVRDKDGYRVGLFDKAVHGTPDLDKMAQDVYYESFRKTLNESASVHIDTHLSADDMIEKISAKISSNVSFKVKDEQTILVTMRADPEFSKAMQDLFGMPSFLIDSFTTIHLNKALNEIVNESKADDIYFRSFSEAVQFAREKAEKKGFTIDEDDWFNRVNTGPGKPSVGETFSTSIGLFKDGKKVNKTLNIQVYGMKNSFELTSYIA